MGRSLDAMPEQDLRIRIRSDFSNQHVLIVRTRVPGNVIEANPPAAIITGRADVVILQPFDEWSTGWPNDNPSEAGIGRLAVLGIMLFDCRLSDCLCELVERSRGQ